MPNRCFVVARCPSIQGSEYTRLNVIDNGDGTVSLYVQDQGAPTYPANVTATGSPVVAPSGSGFVTGSGTTGKLPKWTNGAASALGDSIVSESAGVITIGGALSVSGNLTVPGLTANAFLFSGVGGLLTVTAAPTNGQLLIGSTGAAPVAAALTAGSGVTITNGAGSITISATGSGGTVTSVSVITANGVSGSVATPTTTPAITITLGAISPSSVTASGALQSGIVSAATGSLNLANTASAFLTTLQAGNAVAARTYVWPTDFGAAGSALTDAAGNGTLSWVVPATTTINPTNNVLPQRSSATAFINSPITGSVPASMVDGITVTGAATANPATVTIAATGPDPNIFLDLTPQGTGGVRFPFGTAANPGLGFQTTTDRGIFGASSGLWITIAGGAIAGADASGFYVGASKLLGVSSGVVGTNAIDTSLSRKAAGVWQFGTSAANASGSFLGLVTLTVQAATPLNVSAGVSYTTYTNEGAGAQIVFNLPAAAAGLTYTFIVQNNNGIQVKANGTNTIRLASAVSSAGGTATSTTVGSSITLVAINATEWIAREITGTWITA